jgi:hypothetical protein
MKCAENVNEFGRILEWWNRKAGIMEGWKNGKRIRRQNTVDRRQ